MRDQLKDFIGEKVQERRGRVARLGERVLDFSRKLAQNEVKSLELFINNAYFMKMSDPSFCLLSDLEQMMCLAFWSCQRTRSVPGNAFAVEYRKIFDGPLMDFVVTLQRGRNSFGVVVLCAAPGKRRKMGGLGYPVLSFTAADMGRRSLEVAEEVFAFLERRSEATGPFRPVLPLPLEDHHR